MPHAKSILISLLVVLPWYVWAWISMLTQSSGKRTGNAVVLSFLAGVSAVVICLACVWASSAIDRKPPDKKFLIGLVGYGALWNVIMVLALYTYFVTR